METGEHVRSIHAGMKLRQNVFWIASVDLLSEMTMDEGIYVSQAYSLGGMSYKMYCFIICL